MIMTRNVRCYVLHKRVEEHDGMSAIGKKPKHPSSAASASPGLTGVRMISSATSIGDGREKGAHSVPPSRHRAKDPREFKTATLQIRVSNDLKIEAGKALDAIGISLPEAIRVFLGRIVREQAMPFPLETPNPETAAGLRESMKSDHKRFTSAAELFHELGKNGD